jgi:hypothetical protein
MGNNKITELRTIFQRESQKFHFIMECQFFAENRIQLISRNLTQRPNILKFKQIMFTSRKNKT